MPMPALVSSMPMPSYVYKVLLNWIFSYITCSSSVMHPRYNTLFSLNQIISKDLFKKAKMSSSKKVVKRLKLKIIFVSSGHPLVTGYWPGSPQNHKWHSLTTTRRLSSQISQYSLVRAYTPWHQSSLQDIMNFRICQHNSKKYVQILIQCTTKVVGDSPPIFCETFNQFIFGQIFVIYYWIAIFAVAKYFLLYSLSLVGKFLGQLNINIQRRLQNLKQK